MNARPIAASHGALYAALFAALAAAAAPAAAQYMDPALGRLFTSADERMNLERNRASTTHAAAPAPVAATPPVLDTPPAPPAPPARVTGVVRRSDGRATVWIDDEPRETTLGRLRPGSPIPVDTPAGRVLVKPGQQYDPNNGTIRDPR